MNMNQARLGLLSIFLMFLLLQIAGIFFFSKVWEDVLQSFVTKLLEVYSVHLAVILAGIFALSRKDAEAPQSGTAWAAIILAVFWNLLLALTTLRYLWRGGSDKDLLQYLGTVSTSSSFLVAGALSYFFAKGAPVAKTKA